MGELNLYERVRVATDDRAKAVIDGLLGAVLGRSQGNDGQFWYGVFVYELAEVWMCSEGELTSTGEFDQHESFYDGTSVRVSQKGELLD